MRSVTKRVLAGGILLFALVFAGFLLFRSLTTEQPREAPEADMVLDVQTEMPFQVLIPAYLPRRFDRSRLQINTSQLGPTGDSMIELSYPTRQGNTLLLREWIAPEANSGASNDQQPRLVRCGCRQRSQNQCELGEMELSIGPLRVLVKVSDANVVTMQELQFILNTLGPAANSQIYTTMKEVPVSFSLPPAQEIPVNEAGVQEVTLVVTPSGYSPVHFAVQKGLPVRLIFRQLGEVGCGNELVFQWGEGKSADLILASPDAKQVLEFTPEQSGEFRFNCRHLIYVGVMTVRD